VETTSPVRPTWFKPVFLVILAIVFMLAMFSSLGFFDDKPYTIVPHGNHSHYVPKDRDPNMSIHEFPQQPPPPGMKIAPDGRIVPE